MKFKKTDIFAVLVLVAVLIQLIIVYPSLPDQVVTNWGFDGQVTYGDKSNVWFLYGINVLLFPMFFVVPKIDPKGRSYEKISGFYAVFRLVMVLFLVGMLEIVILTAHDAHRFNVSKIVMTAMALLFIFIGNYLPKCRHSYTMGIKNMWTYADERVWNDTHRFGGRLFAAAGLIILIAVFTLTEKWYSYISIALIIALLAVTTVYSYLSYRKYNSDK